MLKFIVLFFAAFAVFSPLFLIGIRKYTGRRAKRALGANIASFFAFLVLASVVGIGGSASAAGTPEAAAAAGGIAEGLKYVGAALAVGLSGIGGGIAVASEHRINRIWRDLRVDRVSGGTDEMMILATSKGACKAYKA